MVASTFIFFKGWGNGQPAFEFKEKEAERLIQSEEQRDRDGHCHSYYSSLRGCGNDEADALDL